MIEPAPTLAPFEAAILPELPAEPFNTPVDTLFEGAENGTAAITLEDAGTGITILQNAVVFDGNNTFQLYHTSAGDVFVALDTPVTVNANTTLSFASKMALAFPNQVARVQVSNNGGSSYTSVWNKAGDNQAQGAFELVEIDLGSTYNGDTVLIRFYFDFSNGSLYTSPVSNIGWFFDSITIGEPFARIAYTIGEPTDLEQLYLEYINRSRADALAEADRMAALGTSPGGDPDVIGAVNFFGINTADIRTQYEWAINNGHMSQVSQPMAFNEKLITAARFHTEDMFTNAFQQHTSSSNPPAAAPYGAGASSSQRVTSVGYTWSTVGESIFSFADSVIHGHAGFLIDWGNVTNTGSAAYNPAFANQGMQNPPGHRLSNHNPAFKEIGIGVTEGTNSSGNVTVGPQLVTQNFAAPGAGGTFITGVAIMDFDDDQFFDAGEGMGQVSVIVDANDAQTLQPTTYGISSASGGYAVPVPGNGNYRVTFIDSKAGQESFTVTVSNDENVKLDWMPEVLYVIDFDHSPDPGGKLHLTFIDSGFGAPQLHSGTSLTTSMNPVAGATLSSRSGDGSRTYTFDAPANLSDPLFLKVVIP